MRLTFVIVWATASFSVTAPCARRIPRSSLSSWCSLGCTARLASAERLRNGPLAWPRLAVGRSGIALIASVGQNRLVGCRAQRLFDLLPRPLLDYGKKARLGAQSFFESTREGDPASFHLPRAGNFSISRFLGATALAIRANAAHVSGRGSLDVARAAPLTATLQKPMSAAHKFKVPLRKVTMVRFARCGRKSRVRKSTGGQLPARPAWHPRTVLRAGEASLSFPCPLAHRHNACSYLVRLLRRQSEIRDARTCFAIRPRNFTTAGWGNYGHFGSDAMQLRSDSK
jgi:hypothetical protein